MDTLTRYEALLKVRACFETEAAMADYFGVTQPTVWRWLNQSKQIPVEGGHALRAEELGVVTKEQLRPDIYPVEAHPVPPRFHGVDLGARTVPFNRGQISKAVAG